VLMRTGIYPPELRSVNLDFDWIYRRLAVRVVQRAEALLRVVRERAGAFGRRAIAVIFEIVERYHGPGGRLARTWPTGTMALSMLVLLLGYLILYYV
jgi:multicomponent Na+:H+ antiporter subunit D